MRRGIANAVGVWSVWNWRLLCDQMGGKRFTACPAFAGGRCMPKRFANSASSWVPAVSDMMVSSEAIKTSPPHSLFEQKTPRVDSGARQRRKVLPLLPPPKLLSYKMPLLLACGFPSRALRNDLNLPRRTGRKMALAQNQFSRISL
jgi:hypothetical protein